MDVNHLRILGDCLQNLPEKVKPYNGPLVKIIILLSACKASSLQYLLTTSLKSINENVYRVSQQPFACMNDPESKQINVCANKLFLHVFLGSYALHTDPLVRGKSCFSVSVSVCQCVSVSVCQCVSVSVCQCVSVSECPFEDEMTRDISPRIGR